MTGEWIKWVKGLPRKPEVIGLATRLGLSRREAAATLMEVWDWADDTTTDGHVPGVTAASLDTIVDVPGVGAAMVEVGWLVEADVGIYFPNFTRHNGNSAKRRAQAQRRMAQWRKKRALEATDNQGGYAHSVTRA
jgi:hypothetical protein